ncbi:MAG TPA: S8 family serine peptidase [Gemmataceae bacterium]|nr:S8 family serine peptidase [Gemmataceae bacterium]
MFFFSRKRQEKKLRRQSRQPLTLEVLEDRALLSTTPTTVLDLNGLSVDQTKYSSTDILVRFQETPGKAGGPAIVSGTTLGSALPLTNGFYQIDLGKGMTVAKALSAYKAEKGVLDAEPDYELTVSSVPNDPLLSQQWSLNNTGQSGGKAGADIHAEQAWSVTNSSPNVVVAVLDTGIDYDQPDLYDNIWINQGEIPDYWYTKSSPSSGYNKIVYKSQIKTATPGVITFRDLNNWVNKGLVWDNNGDGHIDAGDLLRSIKQGGWMSGSSTKDGDSAHPNDLFGWNFVSNNNNPMDDNGHGTNVAGILGAVGNNGAGVAGVDWNVQIMPVKFIGANGYGSVSSFIDALDYAVQHGAKITNNSWEGAPYSQPLYNAFLNAEQHGVIAVAAAGNEGANNDTNTDYPASFSTSLNNVVTVAATTNTDQLASFSNYGVNSVDLAAPGVNILSTLPNGRYGAMSGTSMATPEVTGALALVWGQHPNWSYTQVIDQVLNTTDKLASLQGKVKTGGRLDLAAAVGWNLSTQTRPEITSVKPEGSTSNTMDRIVLTFNEAIDVSSFSASAVSLTKPNGDKIPVSVQVVSNSGDRQIELWFANQTMLGNYKLTINSSVRDLQGVAMWTYNTTIVLQAPKTYTHSTATTIKAHALTTSTLSMPSGTIGDLTVKLNINYPYDRDLYIYLISPTGKTIALDYNRGGWSANFTNTVFSQDASTPIGNGKAPFSGTYRPDGSLDQLTGTSSGGSWRLAVYNSGSKSGTLLNWSLTVTPAISVSNVPTSTATKPAISTPTAATKTYANSTAETVKPKSLTVSSVSVPAGANVGKVEVRVNVKYPDDRDLYVYLISPTGKTIALDCTRGGWSANLTNTVFSQDASTPIGNGKAPFSGTYRPDGSLDQLIGSKAGGTWRLAVRNFGTHYGTLVDWSLILTPAA